MIYFKIFCCLAICSALAMAISVTPEGDYSDEYDYDRASSYESAEDDSSSISDSQAGPPIQQIRSREKPVHQHQPSHHHHQPATSHMSFYQKHKHGEHKFTYHQKHGKHGSVHGHSYPAHYWGGFPSYHH